MHIADRLGPLISSCSFLRVDYPTASICLDCCVTVTNPVHHLTTVHRMNLSKEQQTTARLLPVAPVTTKPFEVIEALPFIPVDSGVICSHCGRCYNQEGNRTSGKFSNEVPLRLLQRVCLPRLLFASNLPELVSVVPGQHQTKGIGNIALVGEFKRSDVWKEKFVVAEDSLAYALAKIGDLQARINIMKRQMALDQYKLSTVACAISGILCTK